MSEFERIAILLLLLMICHMVTWTVFLLFIWNKLNQNLSLEEHIWAKLRQGKKE